MAYLLQHPYQASCRNGVTTADEPLREEIVLAGCKPLAREKIADREPALCADTDHDRGRGRRSGRVRAVGERRAHLLRARAPRITDGKFRPTRRCAKPSWCANSSAPTASCRAAIAVKRQPLAGIFQKIEVLVDAAARVGGLELQGIELDGDHRGPGLRPFEHRERALVDEYQVSLARIGTAHAKAVARFPLPELRHFPSPAGIVQKFVARSNHCC